MAVKLTTANYTGDAENFQRHGHGEYRYTPDFVFSGNFSKNVKHGNGEFSLIGKFKISGNFQAGEISGQGTKAWANGNFYQGEFLNGELHGHGSLKTRKFLYVGSFAHNQFSGHGRVQRTGGSAFVGNFKNHKFEGSGELVTGNSKYVGNFAAGEYHGQGLLSGGSWRHEGAFADGKKNGIGKSWDEISRYSISGTWDADLLKDTPRKFLPAVANAAHLQTLLDDKKKKFPLDAAVRVAFTDVPVVNAASGSDLPSISITVASDGNAKIDEWGRVAEVRLVQRFADGREKFYPFTSQGVEYEFKRFVVANGGILVDNIQLPSLTKGQYLVEVTDVTVCDAPWFTRNLNAQVLLIVA